MLDATGHPKRTMKGYEFEAHPFYLSAWEEDQYVIAQANVELDENLRLVTERVTAREAGTSSWPTAKKSSTSTFRRSSSSRWPRR